MNLNYVFSIFILYCKDLLSIKFRKILISFLFCQCIILITNKSNYSSNSKLNIKRFNQKYNLIKIRNKSTLYENNLKISIIHLKNSTYLKSINNNFLEHKSNFNILKYNSKTNKVPICFGIFSIIEIFKGDIEFPKHITSINSIKNSLKLCSSSLILDSNSRSSGFLFINGYIDIDLTYSIPENKKIPLISKMNNYIIRIPFNSSIHVTLNSQVSGNKLYFNESNIVLKKSNFTTDVKARDIEVIEDCIYLHKIFQFSIIVNYSIEIYDFL